MVQHIGKFPSIRRLPLYLRAACILREQGRTVVSSAHLARELGFEQIQVKKDLEITGVAGKTGVGYPVDALITAIETFLNWNNATDAVLIGAGRLGGALLGYTGFQERALRLVAAFDTDPAKIGARVAGAEVFAMERLEKLVRRLHIHLAVLTVPADAAQDAAEQCVGAGIRAIWNFTPVKLHLPEHIIVQREDLSAGLAELSVRLKHALEDGADTGAIV